MISQVTPSSLVLIGISSGCTVEVLTKTLDSVFDAVVLIVGVEEIKSQRNIERLKRELRICYPLIDRLLDSLDCGDSASKHSSDLVGLAETILCPENHLIQVVPLSTLAYSKNHPDCFRLVHRVRRFPLQLRPRPRKNRRRDQQLVVLAPRRSETLVFAGADREHVELKRHSSFSPVQEPHRK
jgi:hypothetical protein